MRLKKTTGNHSKLNICPHATHLKEKAHICEDRDNAKIIQYESNFNMSLGNFSVYDSIDLKSVMVNTCSNANVKGISLECMENMNLILAGILLW